VARITVAGNAQQIEPNTQQFNGIEQAATTVQGAGAHGNQHE
jgi:hypothetical protein